MIGCWIRLAVRLEQSGYTHQAQRMQIVPAQLGDDVGLVGALSLVGLARLGDHWGLHSP